MRNPFWVYFSKYDLDIIRFYLILLTLIIYLIKLCIKLCKVQKKI
jgi:hypothetical protein